MKSVRIFFLVWVLLWLLFACRQFWRSPSFLSYYYQLVLADAEGRRAISYGSEFYRFLRFCNQSLPPGSRFQLIGPPDWSIDRVRAHYYLYPLRLNDNPYFLLVYKSPLFRSNKAIMFAALDQESFILKIKRD